MFDSLFYKQCKYANPYQCMLFPLEGYALVMFSDQGEALFCPKEIQIWFYFLLIQNNSKNASLTSVSSFPSSLLPMQMSVLNWEYTEMLLKTKKKHSFFVTAKWFL